MNVFSVRIEEFPKNGNPWRVDGIGKIIYPSSLRSEPLVPVYLSELKPDYKDAFTSESITGKGFVAHIKVGQIAILKSGYVWLDQVRLPHKMRPKQVLLTIKDTQIELLNFGASIEINNKIEALVPAYRHRLSPESWKGLASSWVAVIKHPMPKIEYMVIPSTVIFQKCLAISSVAVRKLIWGHLHRIVDSPRKVEEIKDLEVFFVEVYKNIKSEHAYAYATLYADPIGEREYARFRNNLVINSVNDDRSRTPRPPPTHIKFSFPFSNQIDLTVEGKFLPIASSNQNKRWGFLVTEITELSTKLVFDILIAHRKNSGTKGQNASDPNLEEIAWPAPASGAKELDGSVDMPLNSGEDPLLDLEKFCMEEAGGFKAIGLKLQDDPKLTQQYRRKKIIPGSGETDGTLTTGDPRRGDNGASELDIDAQQELYMPVTLDDFFETLAYLRNKNYLVETISVVASSRQDDFGNIVNFLPRTIKGCRSWHLASDYPTVIPRGYAVATLYFAGVWHYFIELERKGAEAHTLAHIRVANGLPIERRSIGIFMKEVAEANGWSASDARPEWIFKRIKHSPKKGIKWFANKLIKTIGG
jgi:hypothetical protein